MSLLCTYRRSNFPLNFRLPHAPDPVSMEYFINLSFKCLELLYVYVPCRWSANAR
jgi:hypothetical protein